ncbi:NUDIX domain-containing protein [Quadrisphaera granulorum]|uniref:NUDIX domain-containing protein n=1 Tax=Quadrisphaera granulorum TaxID=317664 RepID=A0A316A6L7_9ACTN|nr:NUDIX domain-containing protein [Quadrisphaera granulorum]PWJ53521.1 NUDIX domain-containing protein [Quadrisphaera granulorum]SZE96863.1 NUDIX domain-containing protein [Quadrisphaera granulorum]
MVDAAGEQPDEWALGDDGLWFRRGARVLLVDTARGTASDEVRLLLVRGHDADQVERSWWFTVGGGIGAAEDAREAAAREVREETGLDVSAEELVGPVGERSAVFDFAARTCRQDELFFVAVVPGAEARGVSTSGWTVLEGDVLDELRWWSLPELAAAQAAGATVYPHALVSLVEELLDGWDGVLRQIGD